MTEFTQLPQSASISKQLLCQSPFNLLPEERALDWICNSQVITFKPGERLLRPDEIPNHIYLVLHGEIRFLGVNPASDEQFTLSKRGSGQLIGWVSLLRGEATEFIQASTTCQVLALSTKFFINEIITNTSFREYFGKLPNVHESHSVLQHIEKLSTQTSNFKLDDKLIIAETADVISVTPDFNVNKLIGGVFHLSTPDVFGYPVGSLITPQTVNQLKRNNFRLPLRLVSYKEVPEVIADQAETIISPVIQDTPEDLYSLGILEDDNLNPEQKYPIINSRSGNPQQACAVVEMICLFYNVPFRRDAIKSIITDQTRRAKEITVETTAGLLEFLGFTCQIGSVNREYFTSVESPAVFFYKSNPAIFYGFKNKCLQVVSPASGFNLIPYSEFLAETEDTIVFALPRRTSSTPNSKFGWNWFTPLLKKYKTPLLLVFITSLLAQLFGLAIPLLLQQIIDKVLSQGNLSSLNILGATMILLALFQGILQALRTYIFVDTTDRLDLTLGSSVIDKLLNLPLRFFEKRSVGELSQRIGELNTIRGFLTGTALISILNIIFAVLYLVIMFLYSPLLSVVALSTLPLYLILVFVVSPVYKGLLRKRAQAQARTQSHLIEVLGGIQTVKAQHFELTARWKWQDRYRTFVNEGFKSTALGATSSEVGNFLSQVSNLLVLWVGMSLVLKAEFTLGQLIAFRIISGNVTGPLLQLSTLYQGFQAVQLSMERLSEIIDQQPELKNDIDLNQIALPPITGNVSFRNVSFRFAGSGQYQLNDVSIDIPAGSFVGVVGQSGSGKSTLMKLLPRLYEPNKGSISIDNYDISKVELSSLRRQIGIVPQDSLLFDGTVAENIALNDPEASTDAIINAAKLACAHDFIMELGQGYATPIAEKGSNLSGGQRQRIAIARTIISNPQLLILDEATSALDYDTEARLCENLQSWAENRTVFFITHRLSTIKRSPLIVLMHHGKVEESGSHSELMSRNTRYSALFKQQEAGGAQ